jgi:hypothetical protein
MVALQAFVDETENDEVFYLGGAIASAEAWVAFSVDWQELLPLAPLGRDLKRNFKFSEMASAGLFRAESIPIFGKVVSRHLAATLSFRLSKRDIERAKARVIIPRTQIDWGTVDNPYVISATRLVAWFADNLEKVNEWLGTDQPIEFYFDERGERKQLKEAWERTVESLPPDQRNRYGRDVHFESDKRFLGLQAADYIAGWKRYWEERNESPDLGSSFFGSRSVERKCFTLRLGC